MVVVRTKHKTPHEFDEFEDWMNENFVQYMYLMSRDDGVYYQVEGTEDACMVKLRWS